jgi:flavin reductase (DIM6/NTAB) family NADH-FMN oxidoreductase RutF
MKKNFEPVDPYGLRLRPMDLIGRQWMLVTAGGLSAWNTMTASWGFLGELWSRPTATAFVRPSRYTYGFMEDATVFSLSFFPPEMRKALEFCGSKSGRDVDKAAGAGLTPFEVASGCVSFEEADLILVCRTLYSSDIDPERFRDTDVRQEAYPRGDYHRMYVGAIEACLSRREA